MSYEKYGYVLEYKVLLISISTHFPQAIFKP